MLLRSNFSSFSHYFIYIFLTSGVKLHIHLLNAVVQFIVFLTLSNLICRSTHISKCFSESLGIRNNESRLYFPFPWNQGLIWAYTALPFFLLCDRNTITSSYTFPTIFSKKKNIKCLNDIVWQCMVYLLFLCQFHTCISTHNCETLMLYSV